MVARSEHLECQVRTEEVLWVGELFSVETKRYGWFTGALSLEIITRCLDN